ncbi:hypothetical protein CBS147332_4529 [Penicillium roqueforti]|nr:hypothetical protein CBS147332_4529 [Penicillium roqueforti]KAI3118003.1 hypothetical protein CBS147331_2942 [Penicillium roqueforti]
MVNACPTFLAKHPAYLRYVREVASGELVMSKYERDEDDRVIIQVGAQYCRYPGCRVSNIITYGAMLGLLFLAPFPDWKLEEACYLPQ